MGLPTSIETLIKGTIVESARIEFKETWDPQASLKTICAFANDIDNWGGGYLVLGVREDAAGRRIPTGVPADKIDPWLKDMDQQMQAYPAGLHAHCGRRGVRGQNPYRRMGTRRKRASVFFP